MATFDAFISSFESAISELENAILDFEDAAKVATDAQDKLAENWEGDTQVRFVEVKEEIRNYYSSLADCARSGIRVLNEIAKNYQEKDAETARKI
ncbi:MAG: WXG100 family type VII secretion target [Clostridia bacterium]|nr:WXG100 family type VII secretion target [Clostridia bacterium]